MRPLSRTVARAALSVLAAALLTFASHAAMAQRGPTQTVMFRSDVPQSQHRTAATPEQLTRVMMQVYAQLGIPLTVSSEDRNDLFTPHLRVRGKMFEHRPSEFFMCQDALTGNIADSGELTLAVLNQLRPSADGTTVLLMQVDAFVRRRDVSSEFVPCNTTGVFEQAVIGLIEKRLFPDPPVIVPDSAAQPR